MTDRRAPKHAIAIFTLSATAVIATALGLTSGPQAVTRAQPAPCVTATPPGAAVTAVATASAAATASAVATSSTGTPTPAVATAQATASAEATATTVSQPTSDLPVCPSPSPTTDVPEMTSTPRASVTPPHHDTPKPEVSDDPTPRADAPATPGVELPEALPKTGRAPTVVDEPPGSKTLAELIPLLLALVTSLGFGWLRNGD